MLGHVYTEELFATLADTLEEATGDTLGDTLSDVEDGALVDTLAYTLALAKPIDTATHWAICRPKH